MRRRLQDNYYGCLVPQRERFKTIRLPKVTYLLTPYLTQVGEIKALCGVDFLTISPSLLEELKNSNDQVPKKLEAAAGQ